MIYTHCTSKNKVIRLIEIRLRIRSAKNIIPARLKKVMNRLNLSQKYFLQIFPSPMKIYIINPTSASAASTTITGNKLCKTIANDCFCTLLPHSEARIAVL